MPRVKGSTLINRLQYLDVKGTPEQKEQILKTLDAEFQRSIRVGLMPAVWYPLDYFVTLMVSMDKVMGRGDLNLIPEIGRFAGELACKGIYKIFFKIGSVEFILKRAPQFWQQLFDTGTLSITADGHGKATLRLEKFEGLPKVLCLSLQGWSQALLELAGAKNAKLDVVRWPKPGDPTFEMAGRWDT